jgi:glycosyltransferase involved in cell wall biosynthesis
VTAQKSVNKIFVNARFLTQPITGVQRYAVELSKELKRLRADIRFVAPKNLLHHDLGEQLGVEVCGRLTGHAWEQFELPLYTRKGLLLSFCNTSSLVKRRQLVTLHDAAVFAVPGSYSWAFRNWYKVLFVGLGQVALKVLTDSEFSRQELQRYSRVPAYKLEVVYLGSEHVFGTQADTSILNTYGLERPFLLAVGSQSPHKNFDALVEALERLGETDFDVVIAGGVNPRVHARTGTLPQSVRHVGFVSDGELRALYENAAGFVHPAYYEGFGLPPLEAMALGCPVIVSKAASLPEVCGAAALYFDPHNPADIADKIRQLMRDETLRQTLRQRGIKQAEQFSWQNCAEQVLDFAESAI